MLHRDDEGTVGPPRTLIRVPDSRLGRGSCLCRWRGRRFRLPAMGELNVVPLGLGSVSRHRTGRLRLGAMRRPHPMVRRRSLVPRVPMGDRGVAPPRLPSPGNCGSDLMALRGRNDRASVGDLLRAASRPRRSRSTRVCGVCSGSDLPLRDLPPVTARVLLRRVHVAPVSRARRRCWHRRSGRHARLSHGSGARSRRRAVAPLAETAPSR